MRVFSAALATETNTFAPMPTGLATFHERAYFPAGQHPDKMQMHGGPLWAARQVGPSKGWTLIEGLVAAAVPNGLVTRAAFETLRDLREAGRRLVPAAGVLHLLDLLEVVGIHQQWGRMQLSDAIPDPLVDELVIERGALPAHAPDQANRSHRSNSTNSSIGS